VWTACCLRPLCIDLALNPAYKSRDRVSRAICQKVNNARTGTLGWIALSTHKNKVMTARISSRRQNWVPPFPHLVDRRAARPLAGQAHSSQSTRHMSSRRPGRCEFLLMSWRPCSVERKSVRVGSVQLFSRTIRILVIGNRRDRRNWDKPPDGSITSTQERNGNTSRSRGPIACSSPPSLPTLLQCRQSTRNGLGGEASTHE
jgi:hypothetical protein